MNFVDNPDFKKNPERKKNNIINEKSKSYMIKAIVELRMKKKQL